MTDTQELEWPGQARRIRILATLIFVALFALPFPLGDIPFTDAAATWWNQLWRHITPWVADHVLRLRYDVLQRRGGGEPVSEYIRAGCAAALALALGPAWAVLDRGRTDVNKVERWLRLYLRLYLIGELFSYGLGKVIPNQFSPLGPDILSQPLGDSSPSGLLWAFMGYSVPYTVFAGLGEVAAGILLCFRRTTTLGALIGIGVMSNVVMLNFAYDVGVKLHSTFYLVGLAYLAAPDFGRLLQMMVLHRPTTPAEWTPLFATPWRNRAVMGVFGLLCSWLFLDNLRYNVEYYRTDGRGAAKPALYGIFDVETTQRIKTPTDGGPADSSRWSRVGIGDSRSSIWMASGRVGFYSSAVDSSARTVRFTSRDDRSIVFAFAYARPDSVHLTLRGLVGHDSVEMYLVQRDEATYRLMQHRPTVSPTR